MMDASDLFEQAADLAETQAQCQVRAALREVALQALQQSLTVDHEHHKLVLTAEAWENIQAFCKNLADGWNDKLREVGHVALANMVQQLVESEGPSLFANTEPWNQSSAATTDEPSQVTTTTAAASPPSTTEPQAMTAYERLRRLGKRNSDLAATEPPNKAQEEALSQLNEMGRKNQTDWPYSWWLIQETAQEIPDRLHKNPSSADTQVSLIPKSIWERQQQQRQQATANQEAATSVSVQEQQRSQEAAKQYLIDRKRKSVGRGDRQHPARRTTPVSLPTDEDTPRPPSMDDGTLRFTIKDVQDELTEQERDKLDAYIPDDNKQDDGDDKATPSMMLLGGLRDLGRFHFYWNQQGREGSIEHLSDKKRRRLQRRAGRERLGDRREERDESSGKRKRDDSRVLRTVDAKGQHWLDFDLGQCVLEWIDPNTGERTLLAFDSLEVAALDEDEEAEEQPSEQPQPATPAHRMETDTL